MKCTHACVHTYAVDTPKTVTKPGSEGLQGGHQETTRSWLRGISAGPALCPTAVTPHWERVELLPYASSLYKTQSSDMARFQQMPKPQK